MDGAVDESARRLAAVVPTEVREVCRILAAAGHQAVTVGGAVRDALLGRPAGDWDVATSAHPEQVIALFSRTIPTGLQHGTVTVLVGQGARRTAVEVTTFRGEGAYSDARRPDAVTFGVPLDEDLARRDLVVNAIAYDPIADQIHDPFGGRIDLAARRLRAVGDPVARFTEDGLRVMRAVRFAATLQFELDPATEAAFAPALPSLARVSQERVRVELMKLLEAPVPSRGLVIARRSGVLAVVLPELAAIDEARWAATLAWVDRAVATPVRLAALLAPVAGHADAILRRLRCANDERERAARLARVAEAAPAEAAALRRLLASLGRAVAADLPALWTARGDAARAGAARAILDRGDALTTGELAIGGGELMRELGLPPGRHIGELLAALLARVLDDPALNEPARLLATARELAAGAPRA
jgi:tRNA nucleotidyltransferase (CCA-adding enzyme)